jgi:hypothetical protein
VEKDCSTHERDEKRFANVDRKTETKGPLGRPMHKWEVNIKIYTEEIELDVTDCLLMAQDRDQWRAFLNMIKTIWFPKKTCNLLTN